MSTALRSLSKLLILGFVLEMLSGCYIYNFFKRDRNSSSDDEEPTGGVIGNSLGPKAGGVDEAALAQVYAVSTTHAPSAIRPDPDLFVRRLLRQYRAEGVTVARQIGQVEQFRLLLGGASTDFAKAPQETYDATSLLAVSKVAEEVCRGLVAPNPYEHGNWTTILPYPAGNEDENIQWLAQRIIARPTSSIPTTVFTQLTAIMEGEKPYLSENWWADGNAYAKYVPVCATLALDADALLY